jgi:hypothetical protein
VQTAAARNIKAISSEPIRRHLLKLIAPKGWGNADQIDQQTATTGLIGINALSAKAPIVGRPSNCYDEDFLSNCFTSSGAIG